MSSKKNVCEVISETLVKINTSAKNGRRKSEEWLKEYKKEANNEEIKYSELFCLRMALTNPDGNPLKGEVALIVYDILRDTEINVDAEQFYKLKNELKEAGIVA
jgi:hypothetical protein